MPAPEMRTRMSCPPDASRAPHGSSGLTGPPLLSLISGAAPAAGRTIRVSAWFRPFAVRDARQEETMALQLTPLHPLFAAEVSGLDLRQTPGPELCAEIDRAMDRYAVLVFRGQ